MRCPSCHETNEDDADECFTCGAALATGASIKYGDVVAGRFEVRARLGKGGMGTVYRAYDRVLEEEVALKAMRADPSAEPERARRFRSEIRLARKIVHRNVCRIYEYAEERGRLFISMELIDGLDLKRLLQKHGPLPAAEAYRVALQVAHGLDAIHEAGIVHRDLKTPNVMREPGGQIRLMDFGIAKRFEPGGPSASGTTGTGKVLGTPEYMSPEQARAETVDFRSDIYALGVVIFELFTGELPFRADTPMAVMMKQVHDPPPLEGRVAGRLPAALRPVLTRALAKRPAERYQTVRALVEDLERARAAEPTSVADTVAPLLLGSVVPATQSLPTPYPTPLPPDTLAPTDAITSGVSPVRPLRRSPVVLGALALVVVAAVVGVAVWRRQAPSAAPATVVAPAVLPVSINVLPWARVTLTAVGGRARVPAVAEDERITPLTVALTEGDYELTLENGGLTPPLQQRIRVQTGQPNAFVFVMPAYDPEAAARSQP